MGALRYGRKGAQGGEEEENEMMGQLMFSFVSRFLSIPPAAAPIQPWGSAHHLVVYRRYRCMQYHQSSMVSSLSVPLTASLPAFPFSPHLPFVL